MVEEIAYSEALKNYHHACLDYERIYERCNSFDVNFFQDLTFEKYNCFIIKQPISYSDTFYRDVINKFLYYFYILKNIQLFVNLKFTS